MKKILFALTVLSLFTSSTFAQIMTVQSGTAGPLGAMNGEDLFAPGPVPFWTSSTALLNIEVDAFSFGLLPMTGIEDQLQFSPIIDFSVDRQSMGTIGSGVDLVRTVSMRPPHLDIFRSVNFSNTNGILFNGIVDFGLAGAFLPRRGIDGYDRRSVLRPAPNIVYFSVRQGDLGRHGSDIMLSTSPPGFVDGRGPYISATALGLRPGDEIDALEVIDQGAVKEADSGDVILFSLARNSTSLNRFGLSAADVFAAQVGQGGVVTLSLFASASQIGLDRSDNLNALSVSRLLVNPRGDQ